MREKILHLHGCAVCLQILQSRKQPLQRVWISKMSSFPGLELQKKHQNPRQARLCCTSETHEFGGVGDENGEKHKSFRDSTVQVDHLGHPSPTVSLFSCVFVAQHTPHRRTPAGATTPKEPFWHPTAPTAPHRCNWRAVVRFVSLVSREKLHGHLKRGGPHVQRGEDFGGFWGKPENPGFQVLGKSHKLATPPRVRRGTVQTADSRARPIKSIPAGPDASGSPTEASGPAGTFFIGRARESVV